MAFFSEEDSNTSDDEVDSDDGQDSDQEYDNALDVEQLERRSTGWCNKGCNISFIM